MTRWQFLIMNAELRIMKLKNLKSFYSSSFSEVFKSNIFYKTTTFENYKNDTNFPKRNHKEKF